MNCPNEDDLLRYHADECAPDERDAIAAHLADCPRCATRNERIRSSHDDLVAQLRSVGLPPVVAPPPPRPKAPQLPGYELRGEISRGGQGIVYRAWQTSTRREVAIKVLRDGLEAGPLAERRFEREIEAVATLRHPGVVQVFDSGQMEDGRRYVVMDYVAGLPLDQYVRVNACDLPTRLRVFAALCDAVHHAHQRGVIHRDLKPSNILVSPDGQPCVLDFGLARQLTDGAERGQTLSGHVAGTLAYLSPEQARGLPDAIDVRSDVYTLGVLAYRLVCGSPPQPLDRDTVQVLQAIAEESPSVPLQLAGDDGVPAGRVPADLETILLRALAKDRARRYQTAESLADDVRSFIDGEPIAARRDGGLYLLRTLLRRYRTIAVLGAALVLVSIGSAVALGWLYSEQKAQRTRAEAARVVADERFQRLRQMAKAFIFDLDPKIRRVPGTAAARAFVVSTALEYLDALHDEAPDDPELTFELAHAYSKIGDVLGDLNSSTVDDLPGALRQLERARALCERLLARNPDDLLARHLLQKTLHQMGDAHTHLRQYERAGGLYRQALELAEQLADQHPEDVEALNRLAISHERMGNQYQREGDLVAAEAAYRRSMAFGQRFHELRPDDLWALRGTGVSRTKLAQIAVQRGERQAALEHYRAFRGIAEQLAAAYPNDRVAQRDLAVAEEWHCILLTELGRAAEALPYCQRAVEIHERLLQLEPGSRSLREALAGKLTKLCESQLQARQTEQAGATINRLLTVAEQLAADSTDRGAALRMLGVAHYKRFERHRLTAEDVDLPRADRRSAWDRAETALETCRAAFLRARDEGVLRAGDQSVPETLATELEMLRATRATLGDPADDE